ncbi:PTS sugar transporter subunit IIA [Enterococcus sp. MJM12]|uniref:PTS sugar transporter subunit IIA n=1 Tax=Candidatus Enterococcus myersii TaxID=2815322 RepID=A0ABS3H4L7_9ENTE|nr:PTS sugar transporter subunit IIA [Enterococcus sp. MJM12]MBO0448406.1 PTS sugar transporter subunit IIA [Enterococcus sp. MJM12]
MKLSQREIDLLKLALEGEEETTIPQLKKQLKLSVHQIRYAIDKVNRFLVEKKLNQIFIEKDRLVIEQRGKVKEEFDFFISHTTPEQFKFTAEQIEYFILLKLLLSDERLPINYFIETLSTSRTSVVNVLERITRELAEEEIELSNVPRKGYIIKEYSFKRFSYFIAILKKMINIREIYSFYYQDNLYSKSGDLVFFDLFDLDILFDSLGETIQYSKQMTSDIDDTNFLFLAILNYKYRELINTFEMTNRTTKLQMISNFISEIKQNDPNQMENINLAKRLIRYINRELADVFEMKDFKVESNSLLHHIQRFIFRQENGIPFRDIDSEFLVKDHKNLYYVIFAAIRSFQNGMFDKVEAPEAALITLYYITEIEKKAPKVFKAPRILIICGEGRAISSVLKVKISNLIDSKWIDTISVFEFETPLLDHYDLIITTVKLPEVESDKVLYSDNVFSERFFEQIKMKLSVMGSSLVTQRLGKLSQIMNAIAEEVNDDINMNRLEAKIIKILASNLLQKDRPDKQNFIFDSSMLKYHQESQSWHNAIRISGQELLSKHSIEEKYINKIISNIENFGSYMIIAPGVLLAHASERDGVLNNGFSMHVFNEPIIFPGENVFPVSVIITIAVKNRESYHVVEKIVQWVLDEETIFSLADKKNKLLIEQMVRNILMMQEV